MTKKICRCLNCRLNLDCAKSSDYDRGVQAHKAHVKEVLESLQTGEFFEIRWSYLIEKLGLSEELNT